MKCNENAIAKDTCDAQVIYRPEAKETIEVHGRYEIECFDKDGNLKWRDSIENVVTTVAKNFINDTFLGGSGYTATVRMLLKGTGTAAAGDTQASHGGWLEVGGANAPTYSGNRPTLSFSASSGGVKSTSSAASFSITSTGTVSGCGVNINGSATKDDTTGTLVSAGNFTGGDKSVSNGDTVNVNWSFTIA